ncbi:MAG: M42 family metallopeptidase [Caldilineales bacterium]|nr:M42 family metallopeptidase [Caldilineales bacterium]MCW5860672.1 M42 family metallopeptidase [Caldilineales bacterium]
MNADWPHSEDAPGATRPAPLAANIAYLLGCLADLLAIPSPSGLAGPALDYVEGALTALGLQPHRLRKGVLTAWWDGAAATAPRALTAHVDTLGAMVKRIRHNGRLQLTRLGGFDWTSVEGEGCWVLLGDGRRLRGSLLPHYASKHVFGPATEDLPRADESMELRLDASVTGPWDAQALGVEVGDFVVFDPRLETGHNGYVRGRYLDNKAVVACLLAAVRALNDANQQPAQSTLLHFCDFEEVGHGGAHGLPADLAELVALDIGPVGEGQASTEHAVSICVKDLNGPYHVDLTRRLRDLARSENINYRTDIYPYYGSDGAAYWRAGGGAQVALIGPGVDATHHYERTHEDALDATTRLIAAYVSRA